jgi:type IV pilus secretin PilQ/predicted competence protein
MASRTILMGLIVIPGFLLADVVANQAEENEPSNVITGVAEKTTTSSRGLNTTESDFRVVEQVGDKSNVQPTTVRQVTCGADDSVNVLGSRPLAAYEVLEVFSPFRLVVDLYGATVSTKVLEQKASGKVLDRVRIAQHRDKVRVVLDCAGGNRPEYRVEKTGNNLRITFAKDPPAQKSVRVTIPKAPVPAPKSVVPASPSPPKVESVQPEVTLKTPERLAPKTVSETVKDEPEEGADYVYSPDEVAGYSVQRPALAPDEGGGKTQKFQGRRISLDFKDADIHNILRLISDVAKINIITSDDVKGKITITIRNVPWDQALDIILKTKKLGKVQHDNIIRIAPIEEITKEQELYQKAAEIKKILEPTRVRIISVNYADASEIEKQVKDLLSERGTVAIDKRTNVLIVKDITENLVKAEALVRSLDTETPQVLIESRVVEANTQFLREVGVQWGGDLGFSSTTGNPTGLAFPSTIGVKGGADDIATNTNFSGTSNPGSFAINLPAAVGAGSGGALGFIFGAANGTAHLNLRLSALENRGAVKIISAPKITTLDNHKALIGQGVSIPISVTSAAGVNTVFVEAKLQLEVTPHITQEGSISMLIKVAKNEPDFSRTGARGDPTILKKEAETQVMVRDGDTTVIGGIYTRKSSDTMTGIPFLSRIPILGWFFRNSKYNDERTELLIFITPRIVNRLQATVIQK